MASFTINDNAIVARAEDVLLACVAYNRPEMRTLDILIRRRSQGTLATKNSSSSITTTNSSIAALPTELLLRVRSHLQSALRAQLALEAKAALVQYESALVEGLCTDCFWWNNDIYGSDVWAWVEAGYRGACACVVGAAAVSDSEAHDPRVSSPSKQQVERLYNGLTIGNRAQWLRAYVSRAHCGGERAWTAANRVLGELGCVNEVQGHRRQRSRDVEEPNTQQQVQSREAGAALTALELKKAALGFVPGGFGAPVAIRPSEKRAAIEEASITLARLQRELDIPSSSEEPSIIADPSPAQQYAGLVYNPNACGQHFRTQRSAGSDCVECVRSVLIAPAKLATYALARASPRTASVVANLACPASCIAVAGAAVVAFRALF